MILTGYVGQYYEVTNLTKFALWGAVSAVFFVHILWLMRKSSMKEKKVFPLQLKVH
ncbi:hypothetical protein PZB74_16440 [Porifericola rhodea]|nr:bacteriorhodopsin [Porifericola rhodea]WKN30555.1 hypothetical protein PZB74_16440 [Porifericola rhodea]